MSRISPKPKKSSSTKNIGIVFGILAAIGISVLIYLMWYVSPEEVVEEIEIIAVTDDGCIGETMDGFPVNLGECDAQPGGEC